MAISSTASKSYLRYTQFVLAFVFLVILAGGVVRTTQSGMGCPDWPTCFGKWIPPISADELPPDFEKYLRAQDIDHTFNVYHTWIEYINRLLGALLGVFIFIHTIWSFFKYYSRKPRIFWLSLGLLLLTGFQGWLGKKVVDHNLAVVKITIHMLVALLIAAIPMYILHILTNRFQANNRRLLRAANALLLLVVVQIVLGTEVREQIDEISKPLGYLRRETWVASLDYWYLIHQILAFVTTLGGVWLFWAGLGYQPLRKPGIWVLASVLGSFVLGMILGYLQMPAFAQPLHLLLASILLIATFNYRLKLR